MGDAGLHGQDKAGAPQWDVYQAVAEVLRVARARPKYSKYQVIILVAGQAVIRAAGVGARNTEAVMRLHK